MLTQLLMHGDVNSYGKTFIGNEGLIFSKGNYQIRGYLADSLFEGNSVCGFEMSTAPLCCGELRFTARQNRAARLTQQRYHV
jgi:hypothetical protein